MDDIRKQSTCLIRVEHTVIVKKTPEPLFYLRSLTTTFIQAIQQTNQCRKNEKYHQRCGFLHFLTIAKNNIQ